MNFWPQPCVSAAYTTPPITRSSKAVNLASLASPSTACSNSTSSAKNLFPPSITSENSTPQVTWKTFKWKEKSTEFKEVGMTPFEDIKFRIEWSFTRPRWCMNFNHLLQLLLDWRHHANTFFDISQTTHFKKWLKRQTYCICCATEHFTLPNDKRCWAENCWDKYNDGKFEVFSRSSLFVLEVRHSIYFQEYDCEQIFQIANLYSYGRCPGSTAE